jgi:asparagine synthase (glutamine-hydrolysing)
MCGIAGFVSVAALPDDTRALRRMTDAIAHRGPDDSGFYLDRHAALGHRRLSIIDPAGGHQPSSNETGSLWITYNGEIFNHASLRPELEQAGHRFATRCDTEMIVHAYEQYGPDAVQRFRGMFAFAVWDQPARTLFCCRDRLGIKPLYYWFSGRVFVFASEIKALLEHPDVSPALDPDALDEYLAFGYLSSEKTLFHGIRKLMPGHHLTLRVGDDSCALDIQKYWDVPAPEHEDRDDAYWIAETRRRLEETVRMRLMSDVPLGMFLSGGVDSSAIAALIKRMTSGAVKTFSVGYPEAQFSELSYAAEVARAIGTEHHEVVVGMDDFFEHLPRLIWHEDEPIAWPSSVALYFVSRLAAREVKVVLTGEGSDELFAGYERYRWHLVNHRALTAYQVVPEPMRRWVRAKVGSTNLLSSSLRRKMKHTVVGRDESFESLYLDNFYSAFSAVERAAMLSSASEHAYDAYANYRSARASSTLLQQLLYADQKTYLVELLMKQDQMSMACSIESRVPFLDHPFVEFSTRVPDRLKIHGSVQKYVLKKAVEDLLPAENIHRRKMGFPTPIRQWLRDERAAPLFAAILDRDGFAAEYLSLEPVRELIERHQRGFEDATDRVWRLLNLQLWGDLFITGRRDRWWDGVAVESGVSRA